MIEQRIGFIGAGQMAQALARGWIAAELVAPEQIVAADPAPAALEAFLKAAPGARAVDSNAEVLRNADVILLATKPQTLVGALTPLPRDAAARPLFVSIVAGVTLQSLAGMLGTQSVIRVMPNTPCLVGKSASAYSLGAGATGSDAELVEQLLKAVGIAYRVDEKHLDAVTGLSGSGPAFVYVMIEALADGGVRMGLPRDVALALAAQTVAGSAAMVLATKEHPAALKDRVASPGGTTIAGLQRIEEGALRGTLIGAVEAATKRSQELGKGIS